MAANQTFDVHVCLGCREGAELLTALAKALVSSDDTQAARVKGFPCLGGCGSRGRASLAAAGRWSWLLGDLTPDHAPDFARFAATWINEPAGVVPKKKRPAALRQMIIGRLPPSTDCEGT